jgi:hypothetical protein
MIVLDSLPPDLNLHIKDYGQYRDYNESGKVSDIFHVRRGWRIQKFRYSLHYNSNHFYPHHFERSSCVVTGIHIYKVEHSL